MQPLALLLIGKTWIRSLSVKLYIKYMACDLCILLVKNLMNGLGINPLSIDLGVVDFGDLKLHEPVQY